MWPYHIMYALNHLIYFSPHFFNQISHVLCSALLICFKKYTHLQFLFIWMPTYLSVKTLDALIFVLQLYMTCKFTKRFFFDMKYFVTRWLYEKTNNSGVNSLNNPQSWFVSLRRQSWFVGITGNVTAANRFPWLPPFL